MEEHQQGSPSPDYYKTLGIPKSASIRDVSKAYRSLVMRWHPDKNPASNKSQSEAKLKAIKEAYEVLIDKKQEDGTMYDVHEDRENGGDSTTPTGSYKHRTVDNHFSSSPSHWKSASWSNHNPTSVPSSFSRSTSRRGTTSTDFPPFLARSMSRRGNSPIMFSQSAARKKPLPIEKKLECTLEELCRGCVKKIKITRNVVTNTGSVIQEEELLRIKVKPGWKKGTKITFEGMGDERPGTLPADIIFFIAEKRHPLFKREDDDLVLAIEIPLVKAITGCTLSIPLLSGEKMNLTLEDIIHPGYEKIIAGQGMPNLREQGKRGDLRIKFLIQFPTQLSDVQRSDILSLLQDSS